MDYLKRRLAAGNSAAFAELYDAIADGLFHYLVTQTGTREDAADVLQETFLWIFRSKQRLSDVDNLKAYCFRIAHNEMLRWRKTHRAQAAPVEMLFETPAVQEPSALDAAESVVRALDEIPEHYRQVVELKFFAQLTFTEISRVLDKPQGTVATWYRRALEQLKLNQTLNKESDPKCIKTT